MFKIKRLIIFLLLFIQIFVYSEELRITILHTNDIHGAIGESVAWWMNPEFPPPLGGVAAITTLINDERQKAKEEDSSFLLIDAGDIWQGTPVGDKSKGQAVVKFFNKVKYDMWALGNHDFDAGLEPVRELVKNSEMPVLCANLVDKSTGEMPEWDNLYPYLIKEYKGIKIGFIGVITDDMPSLVTPAMRELVDFNKVGHTLLRLTKQLRLKGVDIIIVVSHIGISYSVEEKYQKLLKWEEEAKREGLFYGTEEFIDFIYEKKGYGLQDHDIAELIPGIDLIIGGHSHTGLFPAYENPRNHTIVVQAYSKASCLGKIVLKIDSETGTIIGYEQKSYTPLTEDVESDPEIKKMIDEMVIKAEEGMNEPIATAKSDITRGDDETTLGNLLTDAIRKHYNVDVVLLNRGGVRSDINAGEITEKMLFNILPFGNTLVIFNVKGWMLKDILETAYSGRRRDSQLSGVRILINPTFPQDKRICDLSINGEPLNLDKDYTIATSDYLAMGNIGYGMFLKIPDANFTGDTILDILVKYCKREKIIEGKLDGRIKRDAEATYKGYLIELNKQVEQENYQYEPEPVGVEYR
jgi:2',3'-cyclic-nucleotide 2'-phosphodiesterase (5'-nucleotidase family)